LCGCGFAGIGEVKDEVVVGEEGHALDGIGSKSELCEEGGVGCC
jgi:hypothetical protein